MIWNDNYNDLFSGLTAMVFTLNGITIPLGYSMVAEKYKEYFDKNVYTYFIRQPEFKENVLISFICVTFFLFPLCININLTQVNECTAPSKCMLNIRGGYIIASVLLAIWFLVTFFRFSKMIYYFVTNTDEIVFDQIKTDIDAFLSN